MLGTHNYDLHIHIGAVLASSVTTNCFAFSVNVTTVYYSKAPSAITALGVIKISLGMSAVKSRQPRIRLNFSSRSFICPVTLCKLQSQSWKHKKRQFRSLQMHRTDPPLFALLNYETITANEGQSSFPMRSHAFFIRWAFKEHCWINRRCVAFGSAAWCKVILPFLVASLQSNMFFRTLHNWNVLGRENEGWCIMQSLMN